MVSTNTLFEKTFINLEVGFITSGPLSQLNILDSTALYDYFMIIHFPSSIKKRHLNDPS